MRLENTLKSTERPMRAILRDETSFKHQEPISNIDRGLESFSGAVSLKSYTKISPRGFF